MIAIMADIIASVEPQQMVISRSASYLTPWVRSNFSTMASRSGFAPGDGVLVDVVGDGFARRFLNFLRRGKVRKPLRQIDGAVLHRQPGHFANNGFGELLGF